MKATIKVAAAIVALLIAVCSCTSQGSELIGRWEGTGPKGVVYCQFNSDHSYVMGDDYGTQEGTWRLEGNTLRLKVTSLTLTKKYALEVGLPEADFPRTDSAPEGTPETVADITVSGDSLTMTMEGVAMTYTRS